MNFKTFFRNILKVLWIFPVKKNRIVFRSNHGEKYNCSPKYISEYMEKEYPGSFDIVWVFSDSAYDAHKWLSERGIKVVKEKSIKGIFYFVTAGCWIDNHGLLSYIPLRKSQLVINTWHGGGAYKGKVQNVSGEFREYIEYMHSNTSLFLASCKKYVECNLKKVVSEGYDRVYESGNPRSDVLFDTEKASEIKERVYNVLSIPQDEKLILYAPTFRPGVSEDIYELDSKLICKACEERWGGKYRLALRVHPFIEKKYRRTESSEVIYTNDYEDMQELIVAASVLITDYSSCIWDAALRTMPCFIYAVDLSEFLDGRDFHTPIDEWPFDKASTQAELIDNISKFDKEKYDARVRKHLEEMGSYENGDATRKVVERIISELGVKIS